MMPQNEPTIDQMNEAIALFEGYERYEDQYGIWFKRPGLIKCMHPKLQELAYHASWGALMPVVYKIKQDIKNVPREFISRWRPIENELCKVNLINTHYCVYKFITWYNQQKQNNG